MEWSTIEGMSVCKWQIGASEFVAQPEKGARLMRWDLSLAGERKREVLYWPSGISAEQFAKARAGNPILFPFAGRSFCKGVEGQWRDQSAAIRPVSIHGFARESDFVIEQIDERGFTARLDSNEAIREIYPYFFIFRVSYHFQELSVTVRLELENNDSVQIPWCAGHHFYFNLPWNEGCSREDYTIDMPARKAFYRSPEGRLILQKYRPTIESLGNPELIDRIHTHLNRNTLKFGPRNGEEHISIRIGSEAVPSPYTSVVTWSESATAPYFCVEPWMGPPNAIEHQKGLHWVNPGASEVFEVEISLV
jgi:galactose mutarotase-like enzyme